MQRVLLASLGVVFLATAVPGCRSAAGKVGASSKPFLPPDARPAPRVGLSAEEIKKGAKLSLGKCVRCHQLYDPATYQDTEWRAWMVKMSRKAHLKTEQEELLSRYFAAFRP